MAEIQAQRFLSDGNKIRVFGFTHDFGENPSVPGPTIEGFEGDSILIDFWNISQGAPHTIHLHGLDVDQANDGVPHLSFEVHHMDHGYYRFKAPHPGTYLYHCHVVSSIHVQAGMYGLVIIRPKNDTNVTWENGYSFHTEATLFMSEIDTFWHHDSVLLHEYDTSMSHHMVALPKYHPQHFLVNGKSNWQLDNQIIQGKANANIYLRLANIGYFYNRVIIPKGLHGLLIDSDGRPLPNALQSDTIEVFPGERYGMILAPTEEMDDSIVVQYINMNTGTIANEQAVAIQIEGYLGIEHPSSQAYSLWPNPSSGSFYLSGAPTPCTFRVLNSTGSLLFQKETTETSPIQISLEAHPDGIYFIQVISAQGSWTSKIIKQ